MVEWSLVGVAASLVGVAAILVGVAASLVVVSSGSGPPCKSSLDLFPSLFLQPSVPILLPPSSSPSPSMPRGTAPVIHGDSGPAFSGSSSLTGPASPASGLQGGVAARQACCCLLASRKAISAWMGLSWLREVQPVPAYDVPSYEEAVGSGQYPIRQSNLRNSTSQLPSYEDLISAVEAEGEGPISKPAGEALAITPAAASDSTPQAAPGPATANPPSRSNSSRASKILRPLRVRRIKSEKLHLKDFRLNIRNPSQTPVTIEPITPPPQYDDKVPEL